MSRSPQTEVSVRGTDDGKLKGFKSDLAYYTGRGPDTRNVGR